MTFDHRPYADTDAEAVASLCNAIDAAYGTPRNVDARTVSTWIGELDDVDRDSRVIVADGEIVGYAMVDPPSEGRSRVDARAGVRPDRVGAGIGRSLLAWQLDRAADLHRERAPRMEWTVRVRPWDADRATSRLLGHFGFALVRRWFVMEASLADRPSAYVLPAGITSTSAEEVSPDLLYDAHIEAFADHFGFEARPREVWIARANGPKYRREQSRVAFDGETVVAYVHCFDEPPDGLLVGMVGTRPDWRGRGISTALVSEALGAAQEAGRRTAVLHVDATNPTGALGVYARNGFAVRDRYATFTRTLPPVGHPLTSFGQIMPNR